MEKCLLWGHLAPTTEAAPRSCHQVGSEIFFTIFLIKIFSVRPGRARHHDRPPGAAQHAGHLHCREPARLPGRLAGCDTTRGGSEVLSYAIKTQLKATKGYYYEYFLPFPGSLWHKDGIHARKESMIEFPYVIKASVKGKK